MLVFYPAVATMLLRSVSDPVCSLSHYAPSPTLGLPMKVF